MKKILTLAAVALCVLSANAQVTAHKFFDNWSIGVNGGVVTKTTGKTSFDDFGRVAGLELTKQITPVWGLGFEGEAGFKTTGFKTIVDNANVNLLNKVNFTNWFCGYKGVPRVFELEGIVGVGFNHYFEGSAVKNHNEFTSKMGLNFNFNVGQKKAWTIALKPAIIYGMGQKQYNVNNSVVELTAGIAYHFKTSNGKHHFTKMQTHNQSQIDALNATINGLRTDAQQKDEKISDMNRQIRDLQKHLNDARNRKPVVETVEVHTKSEKTTLESVITFRQGMTVVDAAQLPNVERIASYMKNHKNSKVIIKGYASPEGNPEINIRLARERAEAVEPILINKYGIAGNRIKAEGQGVGDMFSEADWNRIAICTLEESK